MSKSAKPKSAVPKRRLQGFTPPEGVPVSFEVASMGARFGAQFLDLMITYLGLFLLLMGVVWLNLLPYTALGAMFALLIFFVRVPYYILSELVWNGRTLGKRIVKIRVISANGRRLTPHQITARNLLKEVEVFTPATMLFTTGADWISVLLLLAWIGFVIAVPLFNRKRQRVGDMIAGTIVVEQPRSVLLPDLAAAPTTRFDFLPAHLDFYGRYELQTLEAILRDPSKSVIYQTEVARVARAIIAKIGYAERVLPDEQLAFLTAFYRAQREHLESRQLFGDKRADKFHKTK